MNYLNEQESGEEHGADGIAGGDQVVPSVATEIEHAEPKSGGSFTRNLDTGELIQTAGPELEEQKAKE